MKKVALATLAVASACSLMVVPAVSAGTVGTVEQASVKVSPSLMDRLQPEASLGYTMTLPSWGMAYVPGYVTRSGFSTPVTVNGTQSGQFVYMLVSTGDILYSSISVTANGSFTADFPSPPLYGTYRVKIQNLNAGYSSIKGTITY